MLLALISFGETDESAPILKICLAPKKNTPAKVPITSITSPNIVGMFFFLIILNYGVADCVAVGAGVPADGLATGVLIGATTGAVAGAGVLGAVTVTTLSGICVSSRYKRDSILFIESTSRLGVSGCETVWGTTGAGLDVIAR